MYLFNLLATRLPLLAASSGISGVDGQGTVQNNSTNPLTGAKHLVYQYAVPLQVAAYAIAALMLIVVAIIMMCGNARLRQACKTHMLFIGIGVMIIAGAGLIVGYIKSSSATEFQSIIPTLSMWKTYLSTIMPNAFANISNLWPL